MDLLCEELASTNVEYLLNSGHFFAQMGEYFNCEDMSQPSSYYMANFINNRTHANATMFIGLCLPSICRPEHIQNLLNEQLAKNAPIIQAVLGVPLAVGSVEVNPQNYTWDYSGWFYLTMVLLALFAGTGLVACLFSLLRRKQDKPTYGKGMQIVQAFNYQESMKIFVYKHNYLNVFNGIKTFSMLWVIFGHLFSVRLKYDVNIAGIPSIVEQFFFVFVTAAFLAVDVFFFIGGFLVAYSFMRQKNKTLLKYLLAVLHRLLRFWPSYIMIILLYYSVQIHTGSGPLWKQNMVEGQIPYCEGAWKTLLFVDNLVDNGEKMCLPWGWYLQNDMQIFVFSILFIMLYSKHRMAGYASILLMMCVGLSLNIYEVVHREIKQVTHLIDFVKWQEYFVNIYIKPWIRCPPYLLGLFFGLLHMEYLEHRKKLKDDPEHPTASKNVYVRLRNLMIKRRWTAWLSQFIGLVFMVTTVILPHDMQVGHTWPYWAHGLYLSFEKVTFTFGIYLLILPSILQVPNISFFLLDTKFFNFTGKISFWVYLIHLTIVERVCFGQKVDFYYTAETVIPLFFAIAIISMLLGFLGTLLVEVPFSKLQKMLFSVFMPKREGAANIVRNPESILMKDSLVASTQQSRGKDSTIISSDSLEDKLLKPDGNRNSIQHQDD